MSKRLYSVVWVLLSSVRAMADTVPAGDALYNQVRSKMIANLSRLPNYTCLQTIERKVRRAPSRRYELMDMVRLEVALVNGKELFSWPGAGNFEDKEISQIVSGGAIGNGTFALHAKSIFQSRSARITFAGEVTRNSKPALRWDYEVPQMLSGYTLRVGSREAIVGYHGSFWADARTLDLQRLEVEADNLPPELHMSRAMDSVDYMRADIGGQDFLLPQSAELRMIDEGNSESVNTTRFTGCRQYTGESVLVFSDPAPDAAAAPVVTKTIEVPSGLMLEVSLETPIASGDSATGDPVTAVLRRAVKKSGSVVAPKGALLHGRITTLRRENGPRSAYYIVGLEFFEIEFPGGKGALHAELDQIVAAGSSISGPGSTRFGTNVRMNNSLGQPKLDLPGSVFFVGGDNFKLARGLLMFWRTESPTEEK
ncbi:MAG: hypothetical protein ABJF23_21540 [Bryobacteraceae bacterium]